MEIVSIVKNCKIAHKTHITLGYTPSRVIDCYRVRVEATDEKCDTMNSGNT